MTVRTRIAPSPTGEPHLGTAYIALFNYAFAKQKGGKFILRIEDTDKQRSNPESEKSIFDALRWLGLDWDEGADIGGEFAPYRQSERGAIYQKYAQELLDKGKAFKCYRTQVELEALREKIKQSGENRALKPKDLILSAQEEAEREASGAPFVIRMLVPETGICKIDDMLRGTLDLHWDQVDAQILLKTDQMPTYHLANVVDDHLMQITHVIRGEEWINSAPKHKLLYEYFGWDMPILCHLPLLRNADKSKLSKRKNPTSINYYRKMGFLPEALLNYLARMGFSMPDEAEKFSFTEMLENFELEKLTLGAPVFDIEKLKWLNGLYIREDLTNEELMQKLEDWAFNQKYFAEILPLIKPRIETFSEVAPLSAFFFQGNLQLEKADFSSLNLTEDRQKQILQFLLWSLRQLETWEKSHIFARIKNLSGALDIKVKDFLQPVFIAITGSKASVSVVDAMAILGRDLTLARLLFALNFIGAPSKKELKNLEKEFAQLN